MKALNIIIIATVVVIIVTILALATVELLEKYSADTACIAPLISKGIERSDIQLTTQGNCRVVTND